jgi:hypothetical protein
MARTCTVREKWHGPPRGQLATEVRHVPPRKATSQSA